MDDRQRAIVKSLFQVAWADGSVDETEIEVLGNLMERLGMSLAQMIVQMDRGLTQAPDSTPVPLEMALPDHASRAGAMELLVSVCLADGKITPEEIAYLGMMARRLDISPEELEQMRQRAAQGA